MSINEGNTVINNTTGVIGTVLRVYDEVNIAIVEVNVFGEIYSEKMKLSDLSIYRKIKDEPKKKSFLGKLKDKFLRGSYD